MAERIIKIRKPESIFQAAGTIEGGTFRGRWHFSFGHYRDRLYEGFGTLLVFNDDTLSPGAVWPLHSHRDIEVVTYCAGGEFRHADERGKGGVLKKGWVQHTTVGKGMFHSEINNRSDAPMRFIQMWFYPSETGLTPSVEQKSVEKAERTNRFKTLVSPSGNGALYIASDAIVSSSSVEAGNTLKYILNDGRGAYVYVLEGGPVKINGRKVEALGAAMVSNGGDLSIEAVKDAELLVADVPLDVKTGR